MLNYLKKFVVEICPSVAATVIGAYIVNHYIVAKPEAPAAAVSSAATKAAVVAKPAEKPIEISSLPEAGVKAKGISERTLLERSASEKATVTEKPAEKSSADAPPAEPASAPAAQRHAPVSRDKAVAKAAPAAAVASNSSQAETAGAPEARRDANDLARAAIERQRGNGDVSRTSVAAPPVRPLPPPIMVSAPPSADAYGTGSQPAMANNGGPRRPTPPADIPLVRLPLDLHAEAESSERSRPSLGEDMLSSMKSVFHAVLPK